MSPTHPHYYYMELNFSDSIRDEIAKIDAECARILREYEFKLEFVSNGWLKPHKQLRPFENNQIINYNLPRSRLREKKQLAA